MLHSLNSHKQAAQFGYEDIYHKTIQAVSIEVTRELFFYLWGGDNGQQYTK